MNKITLISLLIIGGLFIFVLGGGAGVLYQTQKDTPQLEKGKIAESVVKTLLSKAVPSIDAQGQVDNIDGRNITLTNNGDSITVKILDNAQIYSFMTKNTTDKNTGRSQIKLEDIKKDDTLNIALRVLSDGQIEGQVVIVFNNIASAEPAK